MTMITKITRAYIRTYSDNGQTKAYVEWVDHKGERGRTEGEPDNQHMQVLMSRAQREGVAVKRERW
jgi:hypothetical protein